jgi:hypothetical protein
VPYVLLGMLVLGTGLAIGFGLSAGPVTFKGSSAPLQWTCTTSVSQGAETLNCDTTDAKMSVWTSNVDSIPKGIAACTRTALQSVAPPKSDSAFVSGFRAARSKCGYPRDNASSGPSGTFKHFFENGTLHQRIKLCAAQSHDGHLHIRCRT